MTAAIACQSAAAQNTSSVYSPTTNGDEEKLEYRFTLSPDSDAMVNRFSYARALSPHARMEMKAYFRDYGDGEGSGYEKFEGNVTFELTDGELWESGVRVLTIIRDDAPDSIGFGWTNDINLNDDLTLRAILVAEHEMGSNSEPGFQVQGRFALIQELDNGMDIAVELFDRYGVVADHPRFDDQQIAAGPYVVTPLGDKWEMFTGVLFGISDSASDADLRFRLIRKL